MSAAVRRWHKHKKKEIKKKRLWRSLTWALPGGLQQNVLGTCFHSSPTPPPLFVSVLFHHQLHSRKPKGAGVTHGRREGLRRMGGCHFPCQVWQKSACSRCGIIKNNEGWQNFVGNVIQCCRLSVHVCVLQLQKLGQWARESHAEVSSSASDCGDGENRC